MIHPDTELKFISDEIGYGVVAKKFIPKGTITWVQDKLDREFTPKDIAEMEPIYRDIAATYCFRNKHGNFVLCWDIGRYVNHSFNSNCLSTAYDFEIAIRDIQPGEELTDDYGYLNIEQPFRGKDEGTKRKVVYPDDLVRYHKVWDKKISQIIPFVPQVGQALGKLIDKNLWAKIERFAKGEEQMDSIIKNYYDEKIILNGKQNHAVNSQ
jgi:uncharacterized protein